MGVVTELECEGGGMPCALHVGPHRVVISPGGCDMHRMDNERAHRGWGKSEHPGGPWVGRRIEVRCGMTFEPEPECSLANGEHYFVRLLPAGR